MTHWLAPPALAAAFLLSACTANAQPGPDIFTEPPAEALNRGLRLETAVVMQWWAPIEAACGENMGCLTVLPDGGCQIHVWIDLPAEMKAAALRNLVARCGGWTPTGE